jgi:Holliday junction resolvase RusA-like endonuclease
MIKYTFEIKCLPKPRMTRRDKWKHRPIVDHYYAFKDELKLKANKVGLRDLTDKIEVHCIFEVPASWPKKKKLAMIGQPHKQTPDHDNILKGICDIFEKNDAHIYDGRCTKFWGEKDSLTIIIYPECL